jgi:hypothetical protein
MHIRLRSLRALSLQLEDLIYYLVIYIDYTE